MIALDTSVLARYYMQDDRRQAKIATRIIAAEPALFVPMSVAVELYFVLRLGYRVPAEKAHAVLLHLSGLPNVTMDAYERIHGAIYMSRRAGIEFPDALHLAAAARCERFLTFDDRRFARRARRWRLKPPVTVPAA